MTTRDRTKRRASTSSAETRPFIGAKRRGSKVVVIQEIPTAKRRTRSLRLVKRTLPVELRRKRRATPEWLDDPELGPELLATFAVAVKDAKRRAAREANP